RYRNVVGIFMNQILQGRPMTIFGDGTQTRAFTHIQDVAPLIAESIGNPRAWNQVFNVGADEPLALTDLAVAVAQAMGTEPQVTHLPARAEVQHAHSSHAKVLAIFGERTHVSLPEGLREMAVWVRRHGARETPAFGAIEITKHLPSAWRDQ
ncbi:MAG TPA: NAD-dependent epimerase/dehydratase family protein, partial [Vicinamibacterales bacterium]|nr:NAD-dependent epimerase/dehydratase family protein [Vicinamibacterales bacterium]